MISSNIRVPEEHSEKLVFLTAAEKELLKLHYKKDNLNDMPNWLE